MKSEKTGWNDINCVPIHVHDNVIFTYQFMELDPETFGGIGAETTFKGHIEKKHGKYGVRIDEVVSTHKWSSAISSRR